MVGGLFRLQVGLCQDAATMATSDGLGPVVAGIDGSEESFNALRHAVREADWRGTSLHVVHALDVTPAILHLSDNRAITTMDLAKSDARVIWERAEPILAEATTDTVRVDREGDPGRALVAYCDEVGASVLVVGPRGRGKVRELLLGSTAKASIESSHCDVLVVKSRD
jgi:nucleotide-binding universal stress UspA family protein